jgi:hypothetical protein
MRQARAARGVGIMLATIVVAGGAGCQHKAALHTDPSPSPSAPASGAIIEQQVLSEAFESDDDAALQRWLESWNGQYTPLSPDQRMLLPKIVRDAYTLFEKFFDPAGETVQVDKRFYVLVPGSIMLRYFSVRHVAGIASGRRPAYRLTIEDFRPDLADERLKPLSLDAVEMAPLRQFLSGASLTEESRLARATFVERAILGQLNQPVPVTYPHVRSIDFNADVTEARIRYLQNRTTEAEAIFRRVQGSWRAVALDDER